MKRRTFILGGLAAIVLIVLPPVSWYFLGLFRTPAALQSHINAPERVALALPSAAHFRQGPSQCGPYAAAAFLTPIVGYSVQPEQTLAQLPWKLPFGYTHPRALERLLASYSLDLLVAVDAGSLSDAEKIRFLQERLAFGSPVILLTYMYEYQHYIVLVGYDAPRQVFSVYDPVFTRGEPGMTIDENGDAPGNRDIAETQLLDDWSHGGIAGFYTWYALTMIQF